MRDELTEKQIEFYQTNGFLVIEDFLDADELEEWHRCTEESVAERLGGAVGFLTIGDLLDTPQQNELIWHNSWADQ